MRASVASVSVREFVSRRATASPACASVSSTRSGIDVAPSRVERVRRLEVVEPQPVELLDGDQLVAQRARERLRVFARKRKPEQFAEQLELFARHRRAGAGAEVAHTGWPAWTTRR